MRRAALIDEASRAHMGRFAALLLSRPLDASRRGLLAALAGLLAGLPLATIDESAARKKQLK